MSNADIFLDAVDAYGQWNDGEPEPSIDVDGEIKSISEVCKLFEGDGSFMPRLTVEWLAEFQEGLYDPEDHLKRGATFGEGAGVLRELIEWATVAEAA